MKFLLRVILTSIAPISLLSSSIFLSSSFGDSNLYKILLYLIVAILSFFILSFFGFTISNTNLSEKEKNNASVIFIVTILTFIIFLIYDFTTEYQGSNASMQYVLSRLNNIDLDDIRVYVAILATFSFAPVVVGFFLGKMLNYFKKKSK